MQAVKCFLAMGVALIGSIIFFATTLLNEQYPILPYIICPVALAIAGYICSGVTSVGGVKKDVAKWVGWCAAIGIIEAILLTVVK